MSIYYGLMEDLSINNDDDNLGFTLTDGINQNKIKMLDHLYNKIDLVTMQAKLKIDKDPYLNVVYQLLKIEKDYYNTFRKWVDQKLVIDENNNQSVDFVVQ